MRTVTFDTVKLEANAVSGGKPDGPGNEEAIQLALWISRRVRFAWEYFMWPSLLLVEQRQFRADYNAATSYGAPTATAAVEVYYPPARKYYQSLHAANLGNLPANLSGSTYVENSDHWAEGKAEYSGPYWASGVAYVNTDGSASIVQNPADQRFYQCITSHTSGGSFDASKFGLLTPFVRSIDYEQTGLTKLGEIDKIFDGDPRVSTRTNPIKFERLGDIAIVRGVDPIIWIRFRSRPARFTAASYAAATTYAAGALVYYSTTGECYEARQSTTGNLPTDTTNWTKQDMPYIFSEYAGEGAGLDYLAKQEDAVSVGYGSDKDEAFHLLQAEIGKVSRQEGQTHRLNVNVTRSV